MINKIFKLSLKLFAATLVGSFVLIPSNLKALPFNDDMVDFQKRTGLILREPAQGSVPVGRGALKPNNKEEAKNLVNPEESSQDSLLNGKRLFRINCFPCHGDIANTTYSPGPASLNAKGAIPGIDIGAKFYSEGNYANDGLIYATIHYGGLAVMPALGWKLSQTEHWDIVNYVRSVQRSRNAK